MNDCMRQGSYVWQISNTTYAYFVETTVTVCMNQMLLYFLECELQLFNCLVRVMLYIVKMNKSECKIVLLIVNESFLVLIVRGRSNMDVQTYILGIFFSHMVSHYSARLYIYSTFIIVVKVYIGT